MKISASTRGWIKLEEGFHDRPYTDALGRLAIGFGHTYEVAEDTPPVTESQAETLLSDDLDNSYGPAVDALGLSLTQNQFDATCSLVYQLGVDVLSTASAFGSYLRAGEWLKAANAILLYDRRDGSAVPALQRRRTMERAVFLAPPAPPRTPLDVLNRGEREAADRYERALSDASLDGARLQRLRGELELLRRRVWLTAVRGREPDGSDTHAGWEREDRTGRYAVLAQLTEFEPEAPSPEAARDASVTVG